MRTKSIDNGEDIIDSRNIIARVDELEGDRQSLEDAVTEAQEAYDAQDENTPDDEKEAAEAKLGEAKEELASFDKSDEGEELTKLKALVEEAEGQTSEWTDGATLIRRSYWVEYVEELVKDVSDMPKEIPHYIVIDWEKTADNIEADYTTIDFDGEEYLVRST